MTAEELLRQIVARYSQAEFYADEGRLQIESTNAGSPIHARFRTVFARSRSQLWFDYIITVGEGIRGTRFSLEVRGGRVAAIYGGKASHPRTVAGAIVALGGVTNGAIHIVPRMLLPNDVPGRMICAEPAHFREDLALGRDKEMFVEIERSRTLLHIDLADMTLREVRSHNDVSDQLRADARSRGVDIGQPSPWTCSIVYQPKIGTVAQGDLELPFDSWIAEWSTEP